MEIADYIIVGSGCTGAMAAQTLSEAGVNVLLIDGGIDNTNNSIIDPTKNFSELRRTDENQHSYLLGDQFESLPDEGLGTGAQLTPTRHYLIKNVAQHLPIKASQFSPMESLALGGLGGGWGLGCCVFSDNELLLAGLSPEKMKPAYQLISDRIGISAAHDDARKFTAAAIQNTQSPSPLDPTSAVLANKYARKKKSLNENGFYLGRPALALLTEAKNDRKPNAHRDMDFYDDQEKAAYRPKNTIDDLKKKLNFQYKGGWIVSHFTEDELSVKVHAYKIDGGEKNIFQCRKLILTAGALGTARIVLRSTQGGNEKKLPIICNPYTYIPCIVPSRLGKKMPEANNGFAQLSLFYDADETQSNIAMASIYTYRSLMLFRLLRETPLNFRDSRILMQHILPSLIIAGIHHPEKINTNNYLKLEQDNNSPTGDALRVHYENAATIKQRNTCENKYINALRKLGAYALKKVHPTIGASIHYAGPLCFNTNEQPFTLAMSGRLNGTKNVFVADGSGFKFLPAKGITLSLMANAHVVAKNALQ